MDITSPQTIQCCNRMRSLADEFAQLYHRAQRELEVFHAEGLASAIPNTDDVVPDGADRDGRPVITGALVTSFISGLQQFTETLDANEKALLNVVLKIAPNP